MSEWIKAFIMVGGMAITMYVVQKEHSYRLEALEKQFSQHLQMHERDLNEIRKDINQIKVDIARLAVDSRYTRN